MYLAFLKVEVRKWWMRYAMFFLYFFFSFFLGRWVFSLYGMPFAQSGHFEEAVLMNKKSPNWDFILRFGRNSAKKG